MKYLNFICYSLLLMLLFNTSSLYAAPPLTDHTTHTPLSLMPEPLSGSRDTFSLAATWWLPDWQGGQGTRGSDDDGGGDVEGECETYGFVTECAPPKTSGGLTYPLSGLTCHKSCSCSEEFKYNSSNCSGNYKLSGSSCDGKYNACVCKSEFKYNSSNCSGEYQVSGTSCGGKYNSCTIRPECTITSKDCTYGCASYNSCSKCTSCKSNPDCDVADKSCDYGCAATNSCGKCTSCKSCSNTCDSGYSLTACSSSQVQTSSKANQCGNPCYQCRAKTCADGGYEGAIPSGKTCTKVAYAGLTCYNDCHYYMLGTYKCVNGTHFGTPAALHCCLTSNNGKYRVMGSTSGDNVSCTTNAESDAFCAPYVGGAAYYFDCP